ncbi:hypothetical protein [Nocardia seriolae]|uniref:hypothetical protein n=1 Tax=Nocardia seriolae TaxID=37332 RepID=UPI001D16C594|nr:hypothetical protein [Nocardia seriolae]WKY54397.1 hypothetical protein Q5P07_10345 [Nocardia seriolae]WNJ61244.1 hypothetical protein RMO66_11430 [Nocardia seriolae]
MVKVLLVEPIAKTVCSVIGTGFSVLVTPTLAWISRPFTRTPTDMPGMSYFAAVAATNSVSAVSFMGLPFIGVLSMTMATRADSPPTVRRQHP